VTGLTPLHLAIKAAEDLKSSRSVRHLLIKGAQRTTVDDNGRTPLMILEELKDSPLKEEMTPYLKEQKDVSCFMMKTPLKKVERNKKTVVLYLLLMVVSIVMHTYFLLTGENVNETFYYTGLVFFGLSFLFFLLSWCT
jgi:ankyrin repeat protein